MINDTMLLYVFLNEFVSHFEIRKQTTQNTNSFKLSCYAGSVKVKKNSNVNKTDGNLRNLLGKMIAIVYTFMRDVSVNLSLGIL